MEKMINFLFPGDIIEIELDEKILKLRDIDKVKKFEIYRVSFDSADNIYSIYLYNKYISSISNICYILFKYDTLLSKVTAGFQLIKSYERLFIQDLNSFPKIIHRGDLFKNCIKLGYCSVCNLSIKGLCDGGDRSCEYRSKKKCNTPLLGDEVRFKDLSSSEFKSGVIIEIECPIVYGTGVVNRYIYSIEVTKDYLVEGVDREHKIELIKREGLIIAPDITCKGCILKDCNNCKFSDMKNKVIFSKL